MTARSSPGQYQPKVRSFTAPRPRPILQRLALALPSRTITEVRGAHGLPRATSYSGRDIQRLFRGRPKESAYRAWRPFNAPCAHSNASAYRSCSRMPCAVLCLNVTYRGAAGIRSFCATKAVADRRVRLPGNIAAMVSTRCGGRRPDKAYGKDVLPQAANIPDVRFAACAIPDRCAPSPSRSCGRQ